jgi:holo-[acyl-carrier protein] synthase
MILGIGSDIIDIRRIEQTLARFGDRFTHRIYTQTERARAERRPHERAASYAKRFAAKEACSKALGTGLKRGVFWRDMGVINLPSGPPHIHVSLTDDYPLAVGFVIISAELNPIDPGAGQ